MPLRITPTLRQLGPEALSRICRWCGHVCLLVDTDERGVVELDISERAWRLLLVPNAVGLTRAAQTPAYAIHECLGRKGDV